MQPHQPGDFDFIMNNQPKQPTGPALSSPKKLLAIVGMFAVVVLLIIIIISLLFGSSSGGNRDALVRVIAHQTEVSRVIELGLDDVDDLQLKQRLQTIHAVVVSDLREANGIATQKDYTIETVDRRAQRDSDIDAEIEQAIADRELDKVLEENVTAAVNRYIEALTDARNATNSQSETDLYASALASIRVIAGVE